MWLTVLGFIVMGLVSVLSLADHSDSGFFLVVHALQRQGDVSKKDSGMWSISWCFLLTSPELFQLPLNDSLCSIPLALLIQFLHLLMSDLTEKQTQSPLSNLKLLIGSPLSLALSLNSLI